MKNVSKVSFKNKTMKNRCLHGFCDKKQKILMPSNTAHVID
jgi:hypothetical protein